MLADVFVDERTDDIDLVSLFAGPVERAFGEGGSESRMLRSLGISVWISSRTFPARVYSR